MIGRGRFIVLEGGEGSGKTTQAARLGRWLEAAGERPLVAREPGGTALGEAVRALVLEHTDEEMPAASELFLYLASRAAFVNGVVRPALADGRTVVADRFDLSTLAYQGYGRELPLEGIRDAIELATGGLCPDLTVVVDVTVEEGRRRQGAAGIAQDRIESQGPDFMERVRAGYLALAERDLRVHVVDGNGPPEQVEARIRAVLAERWPETFGDAGV